jgi:hypothetical protein
MVELDGVAKHEWDSVMKYIASVQADPSKYLGQKNDDDYLEKSRQLSMLDILHQPPNDLFQPEKKSSDYLSLSLPTGSNKYFTPNGNNLTYESPNKLNLGYASNPDNNSIAGYLH